MSALSLSRSHDYQPPIVVSGASRLVVGGPALKFMLPDPPNGGDEDEAFVLRLEDGSLCGYFNRCTHVTVPMDLGDGQFLDHSGLILCHFHGARYAPESGEPVLGPARGRLTALRLQEVGDELRILGWERRVP